MQFFDALSLLVLAVFPITVAPQQDAPPATPRDVERWIEELVGTDDARAERARARLVEHADAARPALESRYAELVRAEDRDDVPSLVAILATFRAMGPRASESLEFLAGSVEDVHPAVWSAWGEVDPDASHEAWEALWDEMVHALGGSGRKGLERMLAWAREGRTTKHGVEWESVLYTILPEGGESFDVVAEWAVADDEQLLDIGWMLAAHGSKGVADRLAARLDDADDRTRRAAARALGEVLPDGVDALCGALESADVEVRRLAIAGFAANSNVHQLDPSDFQHIGFDTWHGGTGHPRSRPFRILSTLVEPRAQAALGRALADPDEEVATVAAFVLARLSPLVKGKEDGAIEALRRVRADAPEGVRHWALEALARRAEFDPRWIAALAEVELVETQPRPRVARLVEQLITDPEGFVRARPERAPRSRRAPALVGDEKRIDDEARELLRDRIDAVVHVARERVVALLSRAASTEDGTARSARVVLEAMESERAAYAGALRFHLGENWWPDDVCAEVRRLGVAVLPEVTAAYMQQPRFPIGWPTFDDFQDLLEPLGSRATDLWAEALWHWHVCGSLEAECWFGDESDAPRHVVFLFVDRLRRDVRETGALPYRVVDQCFTALPASVGATDVAETLLDGPNLELRYVAALGIVDSEVASDELRARAASIVAARPALAPPTDER
ncbi:MAG: hypothetical protein R3F34_04045 [Planctomycetota bacterium]